MGSIPGQETKIQHAMQLAKKKKKRERERQCFLMHFILRFRFRKARYILAWAYRALHGLTECHHFSKTGSPLPSSILTNNVREELRGRKSMDNAFS